MKTIFHKSSLATSLVASGLVMHLGAAFAADPGQFNTNIAVTSAACVIKTNVDDPSPFAATADFSSTQVAGNLAPGLSVSPGVKVVTVSSNCPLLKIMMTPSAAPVFAGSTKAKDQAVAKTSDGQWPMDFFYSNFKVYTSSASGAEPEPEAIVLLGNTGMRLTLHYTSGATPVVAQGVEYSDLSTGRVDAGGNRFLFRLSAPMYQFQDNRGMQAATAFTTNTASDQNSSYAGRTNNAQATFNADDGYVKFEAYIGAMFGTQPYGLDGYPMASAVVNGETVSLSRTLTVTAS